MGQNCCYAFYWFSWSLDTYSEGGAESMKWDQFITDVCHKFEKDEHNHLLRTFFHIRQSTTVTDYIEQFSDNLHQILVHDPTISSAVICNRFVDGLKREIRAVVMMHRSSDLDTASSLAML